MRSRAFRGPSRRRRFALPGVGSRSLVLLLVVQQLSSGLPAQASVNVQARPADTGAVMPVAGATGGAAPNLLNGAATFQAPITVPPGTGSATLPIGLAHYSDGWNGRLGVGWGLAIGPAVIARSIRSGAPEYDSSDVSELAGMPLRLTNVPAGYVTGNFQPAWVEWLGFGAVSWRVFNPDRSCLYYGYDYTPSGVARTSRVSTPSSSRALHRPSIDGDLTRL